MKQKIVLSITALALMLTSSTMPAQSILARDDKTHGGSRRGAPVTKTELKVKEFSGDFEQWVKRLTITSAGNLTFSWMTDEPGVASAVWMVSDKPYSSGNTVPQASSQPHVVASGVLSKVPEKGHVSLFNINFGTFAPKTPPKTPQPYWVFIRTRDAQKKQMGLDSTPVKVVYQEPSTSSVVFDDIPPDKPKPMTIEVNLSRFTVHTTNEGEGDDDPYLFIAVIYADGTTINPSDLANSSARVDSPIKTHNNLLMDAYDDEPRSGKSYSIPVSIGHFEKGILPLHGGGLSLAMARNLSRVAVLVITLEEDSTSVEAANKGRKAFVDSLRNELNAAIRSGTPVDPAAIQQRVRDKVIKAVKKETLSDWWAPWGWFDAADPDDFIGANFAIFNYGQILDAGISGLPIQLECRSSQGWYTISGSISRKAGSN